MSTNHTKQSSYQQQMEEIKREFEEMMQKNPKISRRQLIDFISPVQD
jgi:hypothetical protein